MSLWETHPLEWTLGLLFFFLDSFDMDHFLKVFIEFVTILLLFYVSVFWSWGMWGLGSSTRDWTHSPCIGPPGKSWVEIIDDSWTEYGRSNEMPLPRPGYKNTGFCSGFLFSLSLSLSLSCRSQLPCCEEPHREVHMTKNWFFQPTASKNLRPSVQQPCQWCWKQNSAASADTRLQLLGRPCWKHPPKLHTDSWLTETMI